jgi:hypothetical protein
LAAGRVRTSQAHVIAHALDRLPDDLDPDLLVKAEEHLVGQAATFGPRELTRLGERVLEAIAPEVAEEAEYRRLLAEERRARKATRLYFRRRGDGSTDINARVPDHVADRLKTYLDGYTSPRNHRLGHQYGHQFGEVDHLPLAERRGLAFCAILGQLPATGLPQQGGAATTVSVIIDLDTLLADLDQAGLAVTGTGQRITAGEARRLACNAGIPFPPGRGRRPWMGARSRSVKGLGRGGRRRSSPPAMATRPTRPPAPRPCPQPRPAVSTQAPRSGNPPPPRPRPRLEHQLPPRRHHHLHPTHVTKRGTENPRGCPGAAISRVPTRGSTPASHRAPIRSCCPRRPTSFACLKAAVHPPARCGPAQRPH